jgi:hypothetical protein
LEQAGIDHDKISIISNNSDNWHAGHKHSDGENDTAEGAGKGATTGAALGGGAGLLAGLGMLAIPGLGPVVAAGWLAATLAGAVGGAAVGAATGGLLGALKDAGHSDDEAQVYSEGVRRGGTLVTVKADDDMAARAETILNQRSGADAATRGQAYRAGGWSKFDASAAPYSTDQIAKERAQYGETRSFASGGGSSPSEGDVGDGPRESGTGAPNPLNR